MTTAQDDTVATPAEPTRCGFVAIIGAPNAGKSTLVNKLVGAKIAIVTPKVQTTRTRLLGIALHGPTQLMLVDTPGIFRPKRRFERAMVKAAWKGASDAESMIPTDAPEALSEAGVGQAAGAVDCAPAAGTKPSTSAQATQGRNMKRVPDELFMVRADSDCQRSIFSRTINVRGTGRVRKSPRESPDRPV